MAARKFTTEVTEGTEGIVNVPGVWEWLGATIHVPGTKDSPIMQMAPRLL